MATLVTQYYQIPSKRPPTQYWEWMKAFLTQCPAQMVIFTDALSVARIASHRGLSLPDPLPERGVAARDERTILIIRPWAELPYAEYQPLFDKSHGMDPEKSKHSPELYRVWAAKAQLVKLVVTELGNPWGSKWIVYADIGSCREPETAIEEREIIRKVLATFPSVETLEEQCPQDRVVFHSLKPVQPRERVIGATGIPAFLENRSPSEGCDANHRVQGGFFAGTVPAMLRWADVYTRMLELYRKSNTFAGKDENLITTASIIEPGSLYLISVPNMDWFWFRKRWSDLNLSAKGRLIKGLRTTTPVALDLRGIDNFWIGLDSETVRNTSMDALCKELFPRASVSRRIPGVAVPAIGRLASLGMSHVRAIEAGLELPPSGAAGARPFLVMENDCAAHPGHQLDIQIPSDADGLFIGITDYSALPDQSKWNSQRGSERLAVPGYPGLYRVYNMLGLHAYIVITPRFGRALQRCMVEAASLKVDCDTVTARILPSFNVYAVADPPIVYRDAKLGGQEVGSKVRWSSNTAPSPGGIVPLALRS